MKFALCAVSLLFALASVPNVCADDWEQILDTEASFGDKDGECGLVGEPAKLQAYSGSKVTWTLKTEDDVCKGLLVSVAKFARSDDEHCQAHSGSESPPIEYDDTDCKAKKLRGKGKTRKLKCKVLESDGARECWQYQVVKVSDADDDPDGGTPIADPELEVRRPPS